MVGKAVARVAGLVVGALVYCQALGVSAAETNVNCQNDTAFRAQIVDRNDKLLAASIVGSGPNKPIQRYYPGEELTGNIIGYVGDSGAGELGLERQLDEKLKSAQEPFHAALDLRVQRILHNELVDATDNSRATAANGIVMDVNTDELLAMVSLPDFDPNDQKTMASKTTFNRNTQGAYEMGGLFIAFNVAMALESRKAHLGDYFDVSRNIRVGRYLIGDGEKNRRQMTAEEVFLNSSSLGAVRIMAAVGVAQQKAFMKSLGFFNRSAIEYPDSEVYTPVAPKEWRDIDATLASFGRRLAVTPLQLITSFSSLVNGGLLVKPTLLMSADVNQNAVRVISEDTSAHMRTLMRNMVVNGTASKKADVRGYGVGGSTSIARATFDLKETYDGPSYNTGEADDEIEYARYFLDNQIYRRISVFVGAFPIDKPQYAILVMIKEPSPAYGPFEAASSTLAGKVIKEMAPLLGVVPYGDN